MVRVTLSSVSWDPSAGERLEAGYVIEVNVIEQVYKE